ncbi:MAG: ubiquinone biosynthesis protein [Micavibrio aeruginosavorus]|uniref:Ubiquinone biosynthesis protein n=1 Tax=Micavibrio aeruginosavorus TaxID=349221 RepID=A0A2W5FND0_9BACT|nr:MAG: ubiquinone biosynthesis protein [Micavibrio aeruginosavorus]
MSSLRKQGSLCKICKAAYVPHMAKSKNNYDIIIVGGGLSGLTLACLLGTHNFSVLCLDRDVPANNNANARATVLSHGTSLVLKEAGLWDKIEPLACPIYKIDILDGNSPVLMDFLSSDVGGKAFGHNIENSLLLNLLEQKIKKLKTVNHLTSTEIADIRTDDAAAYITTKDKKKYSAPLLIGADGRNSFIRKFLNITTHGWNYEQTAIVAILEHKNPHNNVAIEHFRSEGPLAILPLSNDATGNHRSTLVWTVETRNAKSFLDMDEDVFNTAIAARIPHSYGRITLVSKRMSYPLSLQHAHHYIGNRIALIADAAHGMHPIAGQGLNMGMRDIKSLSDILIDARNTKKDFGSDSILTKYQRARHFDNMTMMAATDALNKLFSNDLPFVGHLRRIGVAAINKIPPAKRFFMHQAMGLKSRRHCEKR